MEQSRTKWASMLAFIDDIVEHLPEWSYEGNENLLKFTELWLNRIHECHKFNNLLNAIKKNLREEVDMLENKITQQKVCPIKAWADWNETLDNTLVKLTNGAINVPRVKHEIVVVDLVTPEAVDDEQVKANGRPMKRKRVYAGDKKDLVTDGCFYV